MCDIIFVWSNLEDYIIKQQVKISIINVLWDISVQ